MFDWSTIWRDAQEQSVFYPIFRAYSWIGSIKRYESFPFYIQPGAKKAANFEDSVLKFCDYLVDAHELERNKADAGATQYERTNYVARNFLRYQNDTMANLMFDTCIRKSDYDRLNSIVSKQNTIYYAGSTFMHLTILAYASYFFRFRRLSKVQVAAVGTAYYYGFDSINQTLYKLLVDKKIIDEARKMGYEKHIQPNGSFKNRGLNF